MSNIGNLVDRTYREYLEPMDDLVSYTTLSTGINNSVTTLTFNGDLLSVEEEDAMDAGTVIEINQELMLCTDLNAVTNTVTVTRGARGTTAAAHTAGDLIKISPPFPRKNVFDAVCDQIKNLYPTLFAVETKQVSAKVGYIPLSGTNDNYLIAPIKAISQYTDFSAGTDDTGIVYSGVTVELVDLPNPFTYTDSDGVSQTITYSNNGPNKVNAVQVYNVNAGHTVYITFKKKFVEPTAEDNTLAEIGLESEYEPIIMAGVAAQIMAGRDIPTATTDYISDQLATQSFPVESASRIRNSLLAYQRALIQQARKDLRARYPEPVTINNLSYG
jgi:hypothetical protein|tara:strand:- start:3326 stop:4315 length:990 start_codon:yes stop_codon:yes gene_type:complete